MENESEVQFKALGDLIQNKSVSDLQKIEDSKKITDKIDNIIKGSEYNMKRGIISELVSNLCDMSDTSVLSSTVGNLNDAINNNFVDKVIVNSNEFQNNSKHIADLVTQTLVSTDTTNPDFLNIKMLNDQAKDTIPSVLTSSEFYQKFPNDQESGVNLQNNLQRYTGLMHELKKVAISYEGVYETMDLLAGACIY
jgi:hypothetical protein